MDYIVDPRSTRQAKSLIDRGDSVEFISPREKNQKKREIIDNVLVHRVNCQKYNGNNIIKYLVRYFIFFIHVFFKLTFLYLKNHYDVIQVNTLPDFLIFTALIPKFMNCRLLLDVHDLLPELYMTKFNITRDHLIIRFLVFVEKCSINFSDQSLAVHKTHRQVLVDHGNPAEKIHSILNVPDENIFIKGLKDKYTNSPNKFRIIYHGNIAYRHGLNVAIRAVHMLKDDIKGLEFKIIGKGDEVPGLLSLVNELNLRDIIKITNTYVPLKDLPIIISESDIAIVPMLNDEFTKYILPTKLLEYVALGIPVICSRTETIISYFNDEMVSYFEPGNYQQLSNCIKELYSSINKRKTLAKNAYKFTNTYNWKNEKIKYLSIIDSYKNHFYNK